MKSRFLTIAIIGLATSLAACSPREKKAFSIEAKFVPAFNALASLASFSGVSITSGLDTVIMSGQMPNARTLAFTVNLDAENMEDEEDFLHKIVIGPAWDSLSFDDQKALLLHEWKHKDGDGHVNDGCSNGNQADVRNQYLVSDFRGPFQVFMMQKAMGASTTKQIPCMYSTPEQAALAGEPNPTAN